MFRSPRIACSLALGCAALFASGCGRLGFDPLADGGGGVEPRDGGGAAMDGGVSVPDDGGGDGGAIDAGGRDGGASGADGSAAPDAGTPPVDAGPATCPVDMALVPTTTPFCIDIAQQGLETWTNASTFCGDRLGHLCTDAQWFSACLLQDGLGLTDMIGDYEWVAELVTPTEGGKRGESSCDDSSSHEIFVDPYGVRCCVDL